MGGGASGLGAWEAGHQVEENGRESGDRAGEAGEPHEAEAVHVLCRRPRQGMVQSLFLQHTPAA